MHGFGWMAKIQFLPALLALNLRLLLLLWPSHFFLGRVYCSVICPLGIMQDGFAWFGKKAKKNRYSYSPAKNILRYVMLVIMAIAIIAGIGSVVALLAPLQCIWQDCAKASSHLFGLFQQPACLLG